MAAAAAAELSVIGFQFSEIRDRFAAIAAIAIAKTGLRAKGGFVGQVWVDKIRQIRTGIL